MNMFVSIFMLMCMAIDRYLAVIRGSWSSRLNKFRDSQLVINTVCSFGKYQIMLIFETTSVTEFKSFAVLLENVKTIKSENKIN